MLCILVTVPTSKLKPIATKLFSLYLIILLLQNIKTIVTQTYVLLSSERIDIDQFKRLYTYLSAN